MANNKAIKLFIVPPPPQITVGYFSGTTPSTRNLRGPGSLTWWSHTTLAGAVSSSSSFSLLGGDGGDARYVSAKPLMATSIDPGPALGQVGERLGPTRREDDLRGPHAIQDQLGA